MAVKSTIRVFTRKKFRFTNAAGEKAETIPMGFSTVPDWAAKDPLFGWARQDGDLEIIDTREAEIKAELGAGQKPQRTNRAPKAGDPPNAGAPVADDASTGGEENDGSE